MQHLKSMDDPWVGIKLNENMKQNLSKCSTQIILLCLVDQNNGLYIQLKQHIYSGEVFEIATPPNMWWASLHSETQTLKQYKGFNFFIFIINEAWKHK